MINSAGERVKAWRDIKGLSIRKLAKLSGVGKSALHRIETGVQSLKADDLPRIVGAFGISIAEFFGEDAS